MRKMLFLLFFVAGQLAIAQKKLATAKVIQKPILLKSLAKTQLISMEYQEDILYFNKVDILSYIENQSKIDRRPVYAQTINFLTAGPNEVVLKQKDSTQFKNIGERNLYKILIQIAPEMREEGIVSIQDKKTKQFNISKTKAQTISMEYATETLYFSKADLIFVLTKKSQSDKVTIYEPMINYLTGVVKPVLFVYNDSAKLQTKAEKSVQKVILELAPKLLAEAKAADKVKKTGVFNKQIFVNPCDNNKDKKTITDKKNRIIFECK